jgi:hypothetical protein
VRHASGTDVPDTTSGFRAYNREAALQIMVVSKFTYTLESIIQAGKQLVAIDHVPVADEPEDARVAPVPVDGGLCAAQRVSIFRIYSQYEPLRVFLGAAACSLSPRSPCGALRGRLHRRQRQGARPVADPRRGAVQRRASSSPRLA